MIEVILIIIEQFLLHVPLVLGSYISLSLMKVPDLSLESAYVTGAFLGAQVLLLGSPLPLFVKLFLIIVASLLGGALVGLCSSTITQYARLPHLLSCIVTFGIFYGINQLIGGSYISLSSYENPLITNGIARHPELISLAIIGLIISVLCYLLFRKQLGYALAIYGNNPHFFGYYGISVRYVFIVGIALANALSGLSGYLFAQSTGFADITMGFGKILFSITALILGKAVFGQKTHLSLLVPLGGGVAYFSLQQLLLKAGFNLKYFTTVQSLVVLLVLIMLYRGQIKKTVDHLGV